MKETTTQALVQAITLIAGAIIISGSPKEYIGIIAIILVLIQTLIFYGTKILMAMEIHSDINTTLLLNQKRGKKK